MGACLFPAPRLISELGGEPVAVATEPETSADSTLPAQGYELRVDGGAVRVRHADDAGLRYARQTLDQLVRQHPDGIPPVIVRDWPDFPVRGYMLDVSRDRVPLRQTLERLVELLALCRLNHFELYTEHTFAYQHHEAVWRDATPMLPADLQWLDGLCAAHGIELSANQNCFGHMERWLKHPEYRERAEAPEGWRTPLGGTLPASVLAPTAANAELALSLVREMSANLLSRRVNIGCDETFELGQGRSHEAVEARGRGRVYLEHLLRLIEPLRREGYDVLFWGDVVRNHPELIGELPREQCTALVWHYEAPIDPALLPPALLATLEPFGITADALRGFAGQVPAFAESGYPHWVCPGTSSWNSLLGRWGNARANLLEAAEIGSGSGAGGYLITDWGDNGHLQPPSISFAPVVYGAGLSWCLDSNRELDVAQVLDQHVFADSAAGLGGVLLRLGELYGATGKIGFNASPLFSALVQRGLLGAIGAASPEGVKSVLEQLDQSRAQLAGVQPTTGENALAVREIGQAIRLARHGAWKLAREAGLSGPSDAELQRDLTEVIEAQRDCWLMRSRAGGLEDSLARLGSRKGSRV